MIRTHDLLITKSGRGPENADFRRFRGIFAHDRMVSEHLVSVVSIRSFPRVGHGVGQSSNLSVHECKAFKIAPV